jgi:hypothetical protein
MAHASSVRAGHQLTSVRTTFWESPGLPTDSLASRETDTSAVLFALSAVLSILLFVALTYTGLQARAGKVWAGGMSVRGKGKGKRRSRSGHGRRSSSRAAAGVGADENAPLLEESSAAEEAA